MVVGCQRQHIYRLDSQTNSATIIFALDWSESNIGLEEINNISIYAYPEDGSSPYTKVSGDINSAYINLPAGIYSLLVFNDFVGDLKGISFKDIDSFDQFYAEALELNSQSDLYYQLQDDEILSQTIGGLAAWRQESFEVSEDIISCSCCQSDILIESSETELSLEIYPEPITTRCFVELTIENLNNAAYIEAIIRGLGAGAYLSSGKRFGVADDITTLYSIELSDRTFSSETDGVVEGSIYTFGKVEEDSNQTYEVVIDIILHSGELVTFTRDVSDQVVAQGNIDIYIDLTTEDGKITLPEGSGGIGVDSWGNKEGIELF